MNRIYSIKNLFKKGLISLCFLPVMLLAQLPKEQIFVDTDKAFYLTGETAWFKVYCLESSSNQLSEMSKVAYLELLDEDAKPVMQVKILLESGKGKGQFFIKPDLVSGVYYLRAYTSWMKNFDQTYFFESSIHIVNSFAPIKLPKQDSTLAPNPGFSVKTAGDILSIKPNKSTFDNREKVVVNLNLKKKTMAHLSVSVYRHEDNFPLKSDFVSYSKGSFQENDQSISIVNYPPEIRTPVLTGRVNKAGIDQVDVFVAGVSPQYYSVPVKENKTFATEVSSELTGEEVLIWTENVNISKTDIDIFSPFVEKHQITKTASFGFNKDHIPALERMSVNAQIGNAYLPFSRIRGQEAKQTHILEPFYGEPDNPYVLDSYTRFPTMDEVFLEYIRYIKTRKVDEKEYFFIWDLYTNENSLTNSAFFKDPALVVIDGVPLSDHTSIWDLDARLVERIDIINRRYLSGDNVVSGIMSISTYKHNFGGKKLPSDIIAKDFQAVTKAKSFYSPQYETEMAQKSKVPDYRTLLYWEPDLVITDSEAIEFYTGDNHGAYRIEVNGITTEGEKIYQTHSFQVTNYR